MCKLDLCAVVVSEKMLDEDFEVKPPMYDSELEGNDDL